MAALMWSDRYRRFVTTLQVDLEEVRSDTSRNRVGCSSASPIVRDGSFYLVGSHMAAPR